MPDKHRTIKQAVVGLELCLCGCGAMVVKTRNRNGRIKEFYNDKCRTGLNVKAQRLGRELLRSGVSTDIVERAIVRTTMLPVRRKRQENIDLDVMTPQERLGALARAAERMGVLIHNKERR